MCFRYISDLGDIKDYSSGINVYIVFLFDLIFVVDVLKYIN